MAKRLIAATLTLALVSTGAQAFIGVGGQASAPSAYALVSEAPVEQGTRGGGRSQPQVNRAPQANRAPQVQRQPQIQQRAPQIQRAPIVRSQPVPQRREFTPRAVERSESFRRGPITRNYPSARSSSRGYAFVRPYRKHRYYGRAVGGIIIGSILAGSAYYAYASPPSEGLCWYWTNSDEERGYWDYCEPPEDDDD
jgi:hypothetical protein